MGPDGGSRNWFVFQTVVLSILTVCLDWNSVLRFCILQKQWNVYCLLMAWCSLQIYVTVMYMFDIGGTLYPSPAKLGCLFLLSGSFNVSLHFTSHPWSCHWSELCTSNCYSQDDITWIFLWKTKRNKTWS